MSTAWTPSVGSHSVTVTPYTGAGAGGTGGTSLTLAFTVTDSTPSVTQAVVSLLTLIDADTNQPIPGYDPVRSGATLDLATLSTRNPSIRANTDPSTVGSVRSGLDGKGSYSTDNAAPNAIAWTTTRATTRRGHRRSAAIASPPRPIPGHAPPARPARPSPSRSPWRTPVAMAGPAAAPAAAEPLTTGTIP